MVNEMPGGQEDTSTESRIETISSLIGNYFKLFSGKNSLLLHV